MKAIFLILLALLPVRGIAQAQTATPYAPVVITEIGAYETADYEWVEIYNTGSAAVDLTGWKFYEEQTNHGLKAFQGDMIIEAGEYAIIANKADLFKQKYPDFAGTIIDSSWSSLKESGEEIGLKDSKLNVIELFTYLPAATASLQKVNLNLADYSDQNWQLHADSNSAGRANEFATVVTNEVPTPTGDTTVTVETPIVDDTTADPATDASADPVVADPATEQTIDPTTGTADDSTTVTDPDQPSDSEASADLSTVDETADQTVESPAAPNSVASTTSTASATKTLKVKTPAKPKAIKPAQKKTIIFNEVFPNPFGPDTNYEFIELKNISDTTFNLEGWKIINKKGFIYHLSNLIFAPNGLIVLPRSLTHLPLDNSKDEIKLYDADGKLIDSVKYSKPFEENFSYQLIGKEWQLTSLPTQGQENIYYPVNEAPTITVNCPALIELGKAFTCDASDSFDLNGDALTFSWSLNTKTGTSRTFYDELVQMTIDDPKESTLILAVSDGAKTSTKTIKLKFAKDAKFAATAVASDETAIAKPASPTAAPEEPAAGSIVRISGTVSDVAGREFLLSDDTGTVKVHLKNGSGLYIRDFNEGEKITLTGEMVKADDGLQLMPRSPGDIERIPQPAKEEVRSDSETTKQVPPPTATTPAAKNNPILWYLLLLVPLGLGLLYYKIRDLTPAAVRVHGMAAGPNQEAAIGHRPPPVSKSFN